MITIDVLRLSARSVNCLAKDNITMIEQLEQYSDLELLRIPGTGKRTVREIREALAKWKETAANGAPAFEGRYIRLVHRATGPKTMVWSVLAQRDDAYLGRICWFANWRQYAFLPEGGTVFEQVCLRELADFVETATREHRRGKTAAASAALASRRQKRRQAVR